MADQPSVFKPITNDQLTGPFSGFLQPTQSQQQSTQQGPPVLASKATSLGFLANKFIKGAAEGRIKAFEQQENQKIQKLQVLQGYVSQINSDPNLTAEAKQVALNKYAQVMGQYGLDAAGKPSGGKGGGKDGGKDGAGGGVQGHGKKMGRGG